MDFKQLGVHYKIAEENNITKAAEAYISQSAQPAAAKSWSAELGVQLFHRSRTDWGLTQAGEIYVRAPERPAIPEGHLQQDPTTSPRAAAAL